ncbi:MAG TPA: hypothetical protein VJZ77_02900 [Blastocatellia bacterium]|nr:hypothetical protein [Blastocatellia bacterium]
MSNNFVYRVISYKRGDYIGASLSAGAMVPFLGWGATGAKIGRKALKGMKGALPAAPKIQAAWGAANYKHAGLMQGIEHIMY